MDASLDMLSALASRTPQHGLPQPFYTDPAYHALDMELIFGRMWLFVGHTCEIPATGDYFTVDIGSDSLIIIRDKEGRPRAFHNTCRHRGSTICTAARGHAKRLVCPYHQWSYGLDGRLMTARLMGETFNLDDYRLKEAHLETAGGYIFVSLADSAPDFSAFKETAAPYLAPHGLDQAKVAYEMSIIERGNWKLVMENNRECYHCAVNHPALLKTLAEYDGETDPRMPKGFGDVLSVYNARMADFGLPTRTAVKDNWRVARTPLDHGAVAMTLDGKAASQKVMGKMPSLDCGHLRMFHLPNTWNHLHADHGISFRVLPISATETQVTTKWLVHKDAEEGVDYDLEHLIAVWRKTNDEDRILVEQTQRGVSSSAYVPGPHSDAVEFGVIHFVDWYTRTMETGLGERSAFRVAAE
ncbi:MAG: aromatic ring-hydroxylating dioxygenase subunit alpha [Hyphomicrobiales bacterium]|nr:aromatic ring-hydroxylating dioxygenase subunit alpha [Hyphomicrobiales bacterium]